jgi:hypothetical protein
VSSNDSFKELLLNGYVIFLSLTFALTFFFASTNNICSHGLQYLFTVHSFQSNDPKTKIQKLKSHELPTIFHLFSYIKREMRERQREKEERRETEEIKIEIQPSQLQTTITFDRKLRLRHATRPHKSYDEIYRVNAYAVTTIFRVKNLIFKIKNVFESLTFIFLFLCLDFFLRNFIVFHII